MIIPVNAVYLRFMPTDYKRSIFFLQVLAILIAPLLLAPLSSKSQGCEKVKMTDFPKQDLPTDADRSDFGKEETSNKYYYGIGVPIDYVKARHLAFIEMERLSDNGEAPFEGASMLMMLYANGFGVTRDLDISIRLACANVGGTDAEIEGRVRHLKDLKSGAAKGVFDLCDDITSGYMSGWCAGTQSAIADIVRKSKMDSVMKNWPEQDRVAYKQLREAAEAFFGERVLAEVDLSGTARAALQVEEEDSLEENFKEEIFKADTCAFTEYAIADFIKADKELNAVYARIMDAKKPGWGTVTQEGIRSTQRTWIRYRDAWVIFGAVRCPEMTAASWKTLITKERMIQLENFADD
jgi:uncharacterized protein YecT (DUF1311 family)